MCIESQMHQPRVFMTGFRRRKLTVKMYFEETKEFQIKQTRVALKLDRPVSKTRNTLCFKNVQMTPSFKDKP